MVYPGKSYNITRGIHLYNIGFVGRNERVLPKIAKESISF